MTTDEALALAILRVPVTRSSDRPVCEIRLQIGYGSTHATISRDTFVQEPHETDFYGSGKTPAAAIVAAIAEFENCPGLHTASCALHDAPSGPCDCGAYPSPEEMLRRQRDNRSLRS